MVSTNHHRLLKQEEVEVFYTEFISFADKQGPLSRERLWAGGTLIQSRANHKSFEPLRDVTRQHLTYRGAVRGSWILLVPML